MHDSVIGRAKAGVRWTSDFLTTSLEATGDICSPFFRKGNEHRAPWRKFVRDSALPGLVAARTLALHVLHVQDAPASLVSR
ncbi:hypothetical protein DUI87_15223 [Hirundo rustica rustica]|uniref:Uncharacterized protein n=1 Tax=Hirundo rustica rustica TaxID=333673 RepID=A0A3M0K8T4_HIRRU|nr:hypothetical protein DUI87_28153 [Hirundo rustica rustica]RMC07754.1 hypothetical protein DUI87_15223 [Hirundo rustica rustica]